MTKNAHSYLVPPSIHDIITQLESPHVGENERMALIQRLEATREHCDRALARTNKKPVIPLRKSKH